MPHFAAFASRAAPHSAWSGARTAQFATVFVSARGLHERAFVRGTSWLVLGLSVVMLGCGPDVTEIVVRDPFAVSVSQIEAGRRTQMVPTQAPPTPSADKIERAIESSQHVGTSWTFHFDSPGAHHWTAWRYHGGAISLSSHDYGSGKLMGDGGIIAIGSADAHAFAITYDRATCELVITSREHTPTRRYGGGPAHLNYELRTPLANVVQIRTVDSSAFSDKRESKSLYP